MMKCKSDLHIHTTFSDGSMCPEEVIDIAKHKGLGAMAITDHDTVDGLRVAMPYAESVGMKLIPGIELSANSVMSVHMLGYDFEYDNPELLGVLDGLMIKRQERAGQILDKLAKYNINIDRTKLPEGNVGRSHIARELRNQGYVTSIQEAFDRYLGDNKLAYVPSNRLSPMHAVEIIKRYDGVAVIAHPMQLYHARKLEMLIEGLIPYGLDGLEVYYPTHSAKDIATLSSLADKYHLIKTGGSDFHGIYKAGAINMLGETTCDLPKELY